MSAAPADAALWTALPVPALTLDAANRALEMNPAAETFLGASTRSAAGRQLRDLMHLDGALDASLDGALARVRRDGAPLFVGEAAIAAAGRAPARCSLQCAPMQGRDALLLVICPREMGGRFGNDGPTGSARSVIGMADMLAHEIKNPLAGITGAAQLLSMGLGAEDRELTDLIVSESRRIVHLLSQVESFGNLASPSRRAINVHDVLVRARRSAQLGFAADMAISEEYDPSLPAAWADPDQLLQVLQNLLKNAAEVAPEGGGTVLLRSYFEQGAQLRGAGGTALPLQIEVVDDGPGVPDALSGTLFEPFVSGRENGTGLGLALAARIMAAHDGWIAADRRQGRTVFRLSLPLAPRDSQGGQG